MQAELRLVIALRRQLNILYVIMENNRPRICVLVLNALSNKLSLLNIRQFAASFR